jgi:hypothetical protein
MCSRSSSVSDLGGGFLTVFEAVLLPLEVIKGVPGDFFEHWMIVHMSNANEQNNVALTTPINTGWVTRPTNPNVEAGLKRSQVKV